MPGVDEIQGSYEERRAGNARTGRVGQREFDEGVVRTMGASLLPHPDGSGDSYFLVGVNGVCPPTGYPGIPVIIAQSDESFTDYVVPSIVIVPSEPELALQRFHCGLLQYRTAAPGALPRSVTVGDQTVVGFESYEEMQQALPFDITYEIKALGRNRGGWLETLPRDQASSLFMHFLSRYSHHNDAAILVIDSIGDPRLYTCFLESTSQSIDSQLSDRVVIFGITIRVEAEFDVSNPTEHRAVIERNFNGSIL